MIGSIWGLLAFLALSPSAASDKTGWFESSSCVDPKGLASCYNDADLAYTDCVNNYCGGGGEACSKSCGGSVSCMNQKCPGLGIDCINACECQRSAQQINCAGSSCWNQVYSCEYQYTSLDFISNCSNPNREGLPFWPTPDDAPGSCSCNLGKIDLKQSLIVDQMTKCSNNMTNINQFSEVEDITNYGRACICCAYSKIISSIWDTCPDTDPSLLNADDWFNTVLKQDDWDECGPYLEAYNCAGDLGYGRADAGGISKFWSPNKMPSNGTKTTSNIAGFISTPVSGDTFTWIFGRTTNALGETTSPLISTVTVTSANAAVTGLNAKATGDGASTGAAASETKPGAASSLAAPSWSVAVAAVTLILSTL